MHFAPSDSAFRFAPILVGALVAATFGSGGTFGVRTLGTVAAPAAAPVCQVLPPPPRPVLPEDEDTVLSVSPVLEVESSIPSGWFHFRVMEGKSTVAEGYSPLPQWYVSAGGRSLQRGHKYHWSCRVRDLSGWSPWFSPHWSFHVGFEVPPPEPKLPQNGAVVFTHRPVLMVKPVSSPVQYRFRVLEGKTLMGEGVSEFPFWLYDGEPLKQGSRYEWTCRVEEPEDTSGWFEPMWSFEIADVPTADGVAGNSSLGSVSVTVAPNPFSDQVTISLSQGFGRIVRLDVYSADGRIVHTMATGSRPARRCPLVWDGRDQHNRVVGPGTYFCRIQSESRQEVIKLTKAN